jgi:N-acyl-D-amino-acid deacylase
LKRNWPIVACIGLAGALSGCAGGEEYDIVIHGGSLVDGTGTRARPADVAVRAGRVVVVGDLGDVRARESIDATGLVVAPGFIDIHNHSDREIGEPEKRLNEGFLRQGVTTIVGGPDGGLSPSGLGELLAAFETNGTGTNFAFYIGHNGIRREVLGEDYRRAPTAAEVGQMRALVREGMEMGAVGLSSGLMYEPGMFSQTDEVIALAREVQPFGGVYDSHVRDPVHRLVESDQEAIAIGEGAGIPVNIAHEKAVGLHNEGKIRDVVVLVEAARARGVTVTTDQYPYDGAATSTLERIVVIPHAMRDAPDFDLRRALRDPALRARLRQTSENGIDDGFAWLKAVGYNSMRITSSHDYPELVGEYLSELAGGRGVDPFDLVSELILGADSAVAITLGAIRESDVRELMRQPWNMIASDGGWSDGSDARSGHPRSAGTFPRVLGLYVREERVLSLEDAVRKMTSLPAQHLGLADRGRIAEGMAADIVVFDPRTIIDRSTWEFPQRFADGVVHLLVNGVPVLRDGQITGEVPGAFLRPTREQSATEQTR